MYPDTTIETYRSVNINPKSPHRAVILKTTVNASHVGPKASGTLRGRLLPANAGSNGDTFC
jgi:hypothetical protein